MQEPYLKIVEHSYKDLGAAFKKKYAILLNRGWGNGYVYLFKGHPWYGVPYSDIDVEVHGGLTWGTFENYAYVIGFDTAHFGDTEKNWPKERVLAETEKLLKQALAVIQ